MCARKNAELKTKFASKHIMPLSHNYTTEEKQIKKNC